MKKIGFIDYYISEWHANNYPKWIEEANATLGTDYKVAYAWAEQDTSPLDGVTTAEWCEKYGVEKCDTIEELCEKSDFIIILAPSNPETHLGYAEKVLTYGKRTYIDKTFAPDFETAKRIFEIGKKYNAPFFSTSALRYASELDFFANLSDVRAAVVTGNGRNFPEYVIHLVEMLVKICPKDASKVKVESSGLVSDCSVVYKDGTKARIVFSPKYPYSVYADDGENGGGYKEITSAFFPALLCDIIKFFEYGKLSFDSKQTLDCMKLREALIKGYENDGEWIEL
ncbi:MAG: hypothetical protein IJW06_02130 [Clostridia bacterium]|nr:hypothetical protein [Clostridia bacterium]